jgi:uncharacterized protein (DUF2252 family)
VHDVDNEAELGGKRPGRNLFAHGVAIMTWQSANDRARVGLEARRRVPLEAHAALHVDDRAGAVRILQDQDADRVAELVPLRHERMAASAFTFYRGAAAVMAADLARAPVSGLEVQLCGDAHLANFGMFASPERNLLFDVNDFDETHPGPWEWDLKRLAASLVIAGQSNGLTERQTRRITVSAVRRYGDAMSAFSSMGNLDLWHSKVDLDEAKRLLTPGLDKKLLKRLDKTVAKARTRDHLRSFAKLTEVVDGHPRILADPPAVVPVSQLAEGLGRAEVETMARGVLAEYARTLDPAHRRLVDSYTFVDMARKAVGVGSVGTRCWIVLLRGRDDGDPLFLQVKEAQPSVLAPHLDSGSVGNQGERVVVGQRLMQAAGDAFLGWHRTTGLDGVPRDFYVRQLHDWKGSASLETLSPKGLRLYAELCAWTLARAHARSGDRIAISAYIGDDGRLSEAVTSFAHDYAALNEADHADFARWTPHRST